MMETFEEHAIQAKLTIDKYLRNFNHCHKVLFIIEKMGIKSPKQICAMLGMAKSNLAILASKLKFQKYIVQTRINKKEIEYSLTDNGKKKLEEKLSLIKIADDDKNMIKNILNK